MTWDRWLYFPSEGRRAENFFALKIWQLWPGANPRTWVLKPSMLPLDQRSRCDNMMYTRNKRFDQFCNYVKKIQGLPTISCYLGCLCPSIKHETNTPSMLLTEQLTKALKITNCKYCCNVTQRTFVIVLCIVGNAPMSGYFLSHCVPVLRMGCANLVVFAGSYHPHCSTSHCMQNSAQSYH